MRITPHLAADIWNVGDPSWIGPAAVSVSLLLVVLVYTYSKVRRPTLWRLFLGGLKLLAVGLIALCLLNPLLTRTRPKPGENVVVILGDNSSSLTILGAGSESRGAQLAAALQDREADWQVRLGQEFDVRRFMVGERLVPCEDFHQLDHTQQDSRLLAAAQSLEERFQALPFAAVLMFTDGNATDAAALQTGNYNVPIFPVLPDVTDAPVDLAIEQISISQTPFEDAPVTVQVTLQATGLALPEVVAWLEPLASSPQPEPETPATETLMRPLDGRPQHVQLDATGRGRVQFELASFELGTLFYRLRVTPRDEEQAFADTAVSSEITLTNNERLFAIERRAQPRRILYVSGRPNWEHKFLNRAVASDRQVQLISLIRIARKEAKFDFRGRAGDTSNSLFRGFKNDADEETEAYNQPVLIRLNTVDEDELRDGFPKTKAALFEYDAIILDDIEGEFFTRDQQLLLDRFVSERGGGLLMLGGLDTFRQGGWDQTSLRDALPVYLNRPSAQPGSAVRLRLTREGWLQPWVRLRATEAAEQQRLSEMPAFTANTALQQVKPAARTMSEVEDEAGNVFPALVVQAYGKGQAGALLIGDLWRWDLKRTTAEQDDLGKAWRQTLRWLVTETPDRATLTIEPIPENPTAFLLKVRLKDPEYQPLDNAAVSLEVTTPAGDVIPYHAEPSLQEPGLFEVAVIAREPGPWRATATAVVGDGDELMTVSSGWVSEPLAQEFASTQVNRQLMEELAKKSGGQVLTLADLPTFVDSLDKRELPVMELESRPLWHSPWLLLLAISLLIAEWGLRRTRGLT